MMASAMSVLATLFITPIVLTPRTQMVFLLPLCLAVSIVYKTTRCDKLRDIPLAALVSWITIVVGMYLVGIVLMVLFELAA
ncbi:MAG: hypothetical protein KA354_15565 [Phycisphaerae bacterium]|nr:hypothetical protein [Phycisphaerae bacterium]